MRQDLALPRVQMFMCAKKTLVLWLMLSLLGLLLLSCLLLCVLVLMSKLILCVMYTLCLSRLALLVLLYLMLLLHMVLWLCVALLLNFLCVFIFCSPCAYGACSSHLALVLNA